MQQNYHWEKWPFTHQKKISMYYHTVYQKIVKKKNQNQQKPHYFTNINKSALLLKMSSS